MLDAYPLDIISLILILSILQGVIFSIVTLAMWRGHYANRLLAIIMLVLVWYQLEFFNVREVIEWDLQLFYGTRYGSWLLLGPLIYIFTIAFTNNQFNLKWKYLIYFVPFLVFTVALPLFLEEVIPERGKYYGMLTVIKFPKMGLSGIQMVYGVLFFIQFAYAAIFTILSYRIASSYSKAVENNFSNITYSWLSRIILSIAIILVSSVVFFYLLYFSSGYERWMDHIYVLPVTVMIYWISIGALKKGIFLEKPPIPIPSLGKYERSSLSEEHAKKIVFKLKELLSSEKLYLDNELNLSNLANQLSTSPHYLSQAINENLNTSFYNLINQYRVEEAKQMLKESHNEKTILQIAFASGFNNKVSFNNYFKKYTGMTPRDFVKRKS